MIIRKIAAAYFTTMTIILFYAWQYTGQWTEDWRAASDFGGWTVVIAIYAVPTVFIYGIFISISLEMILNKFPIHDLIRWVISGILHFSFGFLFGIIFRATFFCFIGAGAAIYFFLIDLIVIWCNRRLNRLTRLSLLAVPLVLFVIIYVTLSISSPAKPPRLPFSAEDAVHFATSGSGTIIDRFPEEIGTVKLELQGYMVERETAVTPLGNNEHYRVAFIERWTKGSDSGEHRMYYVITRNSLEADGSDGPKPPYAQNQ